MDRAFGDDASQEKSVLNMDQALDEMIDTLEKMEMEEVVDNERKVRGLIQRSWAMIFFIRQQDPYNPTLTAAMHDKIERIQRMTSDRFGGSTPCQGPEPTEKEKHATLSWTACYKDECQTHFSEKEGSS